MEGAAGRQDQRLGVDERDAQVPDGDAASSDRGVVPDPPLAVATDTGEQPDSFALGERGSGERTFSSST